MLQINVAQLLKKPIGTERAYYINDSLDILDNGDMNHLTGEIVLIRTGYSILVKGEVQTSIRVTCSRCLETYSCPISFKLEEDFLPTIDVTNGLRLSFPDDPDAFTIDERHTLDLSEAIRQYSIMALPLKPLCREDCTGIVCKC